MWKKDLSSYVTVKEYSLTDNEIKFLEAHCQIANKACSAESFNDLLLDNFSCASVEDFQTRGYNSQQIGGFISSLQNKLVIDIEEREEDIDLYWLSERFVEDMAKDEA